MGSVTLNSLLLTKVVVNTVLLMKTVELVLKLAPRTRKAIAGPPTVAEIGSREVIRGKAATARDALSSPAPQSDGLQELPAGNSVTVSCRMSRTCPGVREGLSENSREITPLTCGAARLLPAPKA